MILQPHTKKQIEHLLEHPTHGVILSGPEGTGKAFVARYVASKLLEVSSEKLDNHPYFKNIQPENGSMGIDHVRELQKFIQLKTPGADGIRRVIMLENAHLMTNEAQNALLKSLEEPPADTVIILTAPATRNIKETIYSRIQRIDILPVDKYSVMKHFGGNYNDAELTKTYSMSGGRMGLMHALLNDEEHQLAAEITRAKSLLASGRYDRLARTDEIAKQKESLPVFLQACKLIISTALEQAAQKQDQAKIRHWHAALSAVYAAEAALPHNPNSKLLLTDLMLSL